MAEQPAVPEPYDPSFFDTPVPINHLKLSFRVNGDLVCTSDLFSMPPCNGENSGIFLISAQELSTLNPPITSPPIKLLRKSKLIPVRHTRVSASQQVIVLWSAGNHFRKHQNLQPKVFWLQNFDNGITEDDISNADVDINTVSLDVLDHWLQLHRDLKCTWAYQLVILEKILERFDGLDLGWCRLGDMAADEGKWKLATMAYRVALNRILGMDQSASAENDTKKLAVRRQYYETQLLEALKKTHFGCVFRAWETAEMDGLGPTTRATLLNEGCEPFQCHNDIDFDCLGADREPTYVPTIRPGDWYKIPRFFSWIIPHVLAGMSTPKSASDVAALRRMGITLVITLTAEEPLPNSFFALVKGGGIRNEFFPTANYFPPTTLQMDRILSSILNEAENGGATLVHCGGGKGRAGSVLACYVALFGTSLNLPLGQPPKMTSHAAIDLVRSLRPGSIETSHQETFIERYVSQAWKRYGSNTPLISSEDTELDISSTSLPLLINGDITRPDVILLIGLQGSGKSHFTFLIRLRNPNTIIASPDSMILENSSLGSASATKSCESIISNFRKSPSTNRILILDRTNPTPDDRKYFISLFTTNPKCIAIFFDIPTEICISRVELRGEHPTLPPWRAATAIKSTAKLLQPPTLSEGFNGIATVRSPFAAVELANILFSPSGLPLFKFPRTKHLLNLGSVTRDDLVMSKDDQSRIFNSGIYGVITEKVDGANMGFSLDSNGEILAQNRSHYIPISSAAAATAEQMQFAKLPNWVEVNREKLMRVLRPHGDRFPERWILFGEWMYAVHSIQYNALPSLFVVFDLYDRLEHRFLPFMEMRERVRAAGLEVVPVIYEGEVKENMLRELVNENSGYMGEREGVVVRFGKRGEGERGKVVREGFMRDEEGEEVRHWRKRELRSNVVRMEGGKEE